MNALWVSLRTSRTMSAWTSIAKEAVACSNTYAFLASFFVIPDDRRTQKTKISRYIKDADNHNYHNYWCLVLLTCMLHSARRLTTSAQLFRLFATIRLRCNVTSVAAMCDGARTEGNGDKHLSLFRLPLETLHHESSFCAAVGKVFVPDYFFPASPLCVVRSKLDKKRSLAEDRPDGTPAPTQTRQPDSHGVASAASTARAPCTRSERRFGRNYRRWELLDGPYSADGCRRIIYVSDRPLRSGLATSPAKD